MFFISLRFIPLNADPSILIHQEGGENITIVNMYIDDFLLISKYRKALDWIKQKLKDEYNIKNLEEMKTIIGW